MLPFFLVQLLRRTNIHLENILRHEVWHPPSLSNMNVHRLCRLPSSSQPCLEPSTFPPVWGTEIDETVAWVQTLAGRFQNRGVEE